MAIVVMGVVAEGTGDAASFMGAPWVQQRLFEVLGANAWPGTLNLTLQNAAQGASFREQLPAVRMTSPLTTFCDAICYPVAISNGRGGQRRGVWLVPLVAEYPFDKVELIAPCHLRSSLGLQTGDPVWLDA